MTNLEIGIVSFPALLLLIFMRVPIGLAMFIVGYFGYWIVTGDTRMPMARLKRAAYSTFASESLAVVPMSLVFSTVFYVSLYFTFADCFVPGDPAPEPTAA